MDVYEIKSKPIVHLSTDDLPDLKKYDVGDTYYALYKCRVVEKRVSESGKVSGDLEILTIKPVPHPQVSKVKALIKKKDVDYD